MKTNKFITLALSLLITLSAFAQKNFYETLENQGADAVYQAYYKVWTDKKGNITNLSVLKDKASFTTHYVGDIFAGFTGNYIKEGSSRKSLIVNHNQIKHNSAELVGFPNTYMVHDKKYNSAWIAIGNYIFQLSDPTEDLTDYREIDKVFIVDGSAPQATNKKGKKKGGFMTKLKNKMLDPSGDADLGSGPEYDKAIKDGLTNMVKEYLKTMKAQTDSYTLTAQDKADFQAIKDAKKADDEYTREYNEAYKRKPEYHVVLQSNANAQASTDRKNFIRVEGTDAKVDNCKYYIKNEGSTTFTYVNASQRTGTIAPGKIQEFSCYYLAFYAEGENKGKLISNGGQGSRGNTISVK